MVIQSIMFNVESVMTSISSLSNDDVIVIKHVELVSNGSRRTSGNASPLMVNLLFFYRKTLVFYVPKCRKMSHHGDISRKLFTLGVNSIIETCGVTSLDVSDQIKFRLCVTVYKSVHGMAPGRLVICKSCPGQFHRRRSPICCVC